MLLSFTLIPPTPPSAHALKSQNQIVVVLSVMGTTRFVVTVPFTASQKNKSRPLIVRFVSWAGMYELANVDYVALWLSG